MHKDVDVSIEATDKFLVIKSASGPTLMIQKRIVEQELARYQREQHDARCEERANKNGGQ